MLVSRARRIEEPAFRTAFESLSGPHFVWSAPGEPTTVCGGSAATVTATGSDRFDAIRDAADSLFASGDVCDGNEAARPRLFGGFAFHEAAAETEPWNSFPEARFVFPRAQVTYADDCAWLTVNAVGPDAEPATVERRLEQTAERLRKRRIDRPRPPSPGIGAERRATTREDWREGVDAAVGRIRDGHLDKVVLAEALEADLAGELSLPATLERLAETYPDCHLFLVEPDAGDAAFFGVTPERLVTLRGRAVETDALAGTTGRGETSAEDEWLADELSSDEKNGHEHDLVVDAIRDQLAPFADTVTPGDRRVRRLATVQHLHTPIAATLDAEYHVLDLVEALHPTPAVGGLPPAVALETIRETEPFDRGWYAAPIGWMDAAGNGTFAVALRSAVATTRSATLFAGVGIVADSEADREWDEVQLKYRPILDELAGDD